MKRANKAAAAYADCRDLGHSWRAINAWKERGIFIETLQCSRCSCEKDRGFHPKTGALLQINRRTKYPEGYLLPKGSGRMTQEDRAAIRLSRLR